MQTRDSITSSIFNGACGMSFMTRWLAPPAMHSQQEVAERAARVIDHVIFDLGVERLVEGLLRECRAQSPRFRALPASASRPASRSH